MDMLFASIGLEVTSDCLGFIGSKSFCIDPQNTITFVINGKYHSDISEYEIQHNDRILISYGDTKLVYDQLQYLESLVITDLPKRDKIIPGEDISI